MGAGLQNWKILKQGQVRLGRTYGQYAPTTPSRSFSFVLLDPVTPLFAFFGVAPAGALTMLLPRPLSPLLSLSLSPSLSLSLSRPFFLYLSHVSLSRIEAHSLSAI